MNSTTGMNIVILFAFCIGTTGFSQSYSLQPVSPQAGYRAHSALKELRHSYPGAQFAINEGGVKSLYGSSFGNGSSPEDAARTFVEKYTYIFGANPEELTPESQKSGQGHTQPIMYNRLTDSYKFTQVYYRQAVDGIPVFRSELRLLVRNENGYPLVLAKSSLRDLTRYVNKGLPRIAKSSAASSVMADNPGLVDFSEPEAVIWAGVDSIVAEPRLAVTIYASNDFPEAWLYVLDAETGEVLYKEDLIVLDNVSGDVSGNSTDGSASNPCEEESLKPMPYAHVRAGDDSCYTDSAGGYSFDVSPTWPVDLVSSIRGEHFYVVDKNGNDAIITQSVEGGGVVNFVHDASDSTEYYLAQVNAYTLANEIRDFALHYVPDYPGVLENTCAEINVNWGFGEGHCPCNAWYYNLPGEHSITFCASHYFSNNDFSCYNTAYAPVLFHEYGHHLVTAAGSGQLEYGEGMADAVFILLRDESKLGLGFSGDCDTYIRDADNNDRQYPCEFPGDGSVHECGQVLSGSIWDLRNEFMALYPSTYRDTLAYLTVNSILLHVGGCIDPQIVIDFLTLDDDDADIINGTPNMEAICSAFSGHNMLCPDFQFLNYSYSEPLPEFVRPEEQPYSVQVEVSPSGTNTPIPGTGSFYYAIDGFEYQQGEMIEVSANLYEITFPQIPCGGVINWYLTAESDPFGADYYPLHHERHPHQLIVATDKVVMFEDDFNEPRGWETERTLEFWGDGWTRDIPIPADSAIGLPLPPLVDYDGSGYCYMTGNDPYGCGVRYGTASLISPPLDFDNGVVRIEWAQWRHNMAAYWYGLPRDTFLVYVSQDSGQNWQPARKLYLWHDEHSGGWFPDSLVANNYFTDPTSIRFKFVVTKVDEVNPGGGVEAGIDAVKVHLYPCNPGITIYTSYLPEGTYGQPYSFQLEAIGGSGELTWSDKYNDLAPAGLSLSSSGVIGGTPVVSGEFTFTAEVGDGTGLTDERQFTIVLNSGFKIVDNFGKRCTKSGLYQVFFETEGGTPPFTWTNPSQTLYGEVVLGEGYLGLHLEAYDADTSHDRWGVHGRMKYDDSLWFTIAGQDANGACDTIEVTVYVEPELLLVTREMAPATAGLPYEFQFESTGGIPPIKFYGRHAFTHIGLDMDASTGVVTGVPDSVGDFRFSLYLRDSCMAVWISDEYDTSYWFPSLTVNPLEGCGDLDSDGIVDIGDLTFLVNALFVTLEPPFDPLYRANVDCSGETPPMIDIGDVTALVRSLFIDLEPLCCGD